jgi:TonB-linked SusC/RagA family outer membrane protein
MKKIVLLMSLLSLTFFLSAQSRIVKGIVTDENDAPVMGANILFQESGVGTITNMNGEYSVKIQAEDKVMTVKYIGYITQQIKVQDRSVINVKLVESATALSEVSVVAVGFGSQKKNLMTSAVSTVNSKDILKTPVANMATALVGRTPGLTTVQASGQPGADGIALRIRGIESPNGSSPLILVDGVERDFTQLDPNEIESISVLKDAASTAVFGIRGANGVMIVTTKKGEEGSAKISVTSNFSIQEPTRLPKMIDAATFCRMYNEGLINDTKTATPRFTEEDINKYASKENPLEYPNNDWYDILLKPFALQQQHNITIGGGTKNTKYYTSIGYFTQDGLMRDYSGPLSRNLDNNYRYNRFNLRSNIDVDVTPTTKVGVKVNGIISQINDPQFAWSGGSSLNSATPISYPIIYSDKIIGSTINFAPSPLMSAIGKNLTEKSGNTISLTLTLEQKLDFLLKGLTFRSMGSYDSYYSHNVSREQGYILYYINYSADENGNMVRQLSPQGENALVTDPDEKWGRNRKMHAEAAFEYRNKFGKHNLYGLMLGTLDKKWYAGSTFYNIPMSYVGLVSRFTYDYNSKYLLELNLGYNGSENFPANIRYALFPAFSAGWNIAEEKIVRNLISEDILDKLKLRASYGVVGNDASPDGVRFLYNNNEYTSGGGAYFGDVAPKIVTGYREGKMGNANVTWETASKKNVGVEVAMFKNKLSFTADVFQSNRKNILMPKRSMPTHVVIYSPLDIFNIGETENHGFELEGKWNHTLGKFNYYIGGNYSFARNKWINNGEVKDPDNPNLWGTGRRINEIFGLVWDGFYNDADELARGPVYGTPGIGNARYIDVNGDGILDAKDRMPIGNPTFPEINYGINAGFSYKGFEFSVLFQGVANVSKVLSGRFQKPFDQNGGMMDFQVAERWTPDNMENATRPRLTINYSNPNDYLSSTMWLRDGAYIKLRNVELSYRFNNRFIKRTLGIAGLRLYVNGQNLYTWDKLKVIDPEGNTDDGWTYPQLKVYNIGTKIDF